MTRPEAEQTGVAGTAEVFKERTSERYGTGCWARCGRRIDYGDQRVRVRRRLKSGDLLFHPECFEKWED